MSNLDVSLYKLRVHIDQSFKLCQRSFVVAQQYINTCLTIDSLKIILIFYLGDCALREFREVLGDQIIRDSD